jgi:putative SOS response-associated peptidase YedK
MLKDCFFDLIRSCVRIEEKMTDMGKEVIGMCGRFQLELGMEDMVNFLEIVEEVNNRYKADNLDEFIHEKRDIYPGTKSLTITEEGFKKPTWGFPLDKKLIINARSETIYEKKMFHKAIESQRCLVPANLFYEWLKKDKEKIKHEIGTEDRFMMLGGIWQVFKNDEGEPEERFAIITLDSQNEMLSIHDRTPLIIPKDAYAAFIRKETKPEEIQKILKSYPKKLLITPENRDSQISLF